MKGDKFVAKSSKRPKATEEESFFPNELKKSKKATKEGNEKENRRSPVILMIPASSELELDDSTKPASSTADSNSKIPIQALYKQQCQLYESQKEMSAADRDWFTKVTTEGTANDKCSALALAVQEAPFYSLEHLETLGRTVSGTVNNKKISHHEVLIAMERLADLYEQVLMPKRKRKLFYFEQRPRTEDQTLLLKWYFEDVIKTEYFKFLQAIELALKSTIVHNRELSCRFLFKVIQKNPHEQTGNVLSLLVNKLGDTERKLASRISFYLEEIIKKNPEITSAIIDAVLTLCASPQIPEKALYYSLTFLSQIRFSQKHREVPEKVFAAYCSFFKSLLVPSLLAFEKEKRLAIKKKGSELGEEQELKLQERLIPRASKPLLTGINRALPFVKNAAILKDMEKSLVQLASQGNLHAALPSQSLLYNLSLSSNDPSSFFSTLLNVTLSDKNISKLPHIVSPLFVLLQKVFDSERTASRNKYSGCLIKRLCQIALVCETRISAGILILCGTNLKKQPGLHPMITMPADGDSGDDTLYELVLLARHPSSLIAKLAEAILNLDWENNLFTRSPIEELEGGAILHSFVQWKKPHNLEGRDAAVFPEFQFLNTLRELMEASRPKRRQKDNKRKRTKKSKKDDQDDSDREDGADSSEMDEILEKELESGDDGLIGGSDFDDFSGQEEAGFASFGEGEDVFVEGNASDYEK
jgi:ribosome biogenesis protein MAK21